MRHPAAHELWQGLGRAPILTPLLTDITLLLLDHPKGFTITQLLGNCDLVSSVNASRAGAGTPPSLHHCARAARRRRAPDGSRFSLRSRGAGPARGIDPGSLR